jgi:hypothetical protein
MAKDPEDVLNHDGFPPVARPVYQLVVVSPLLSIAEHLIGLIYFLKFLLGFLRIAGVVIRMIAQGQMAEGLPDILFAGISPDSEYLIVIFQGHPYPFVKKF